MIVLSQRKEVLNLNLFKVSLFPLREENYATFVDVSEEMKVQPNNSNRKNKILSQCRLALGNLLDRSSNPEKLWRPW